MAIEFSQLELKDLEQVLDLENILFDHPFDEEVYHFELKLNPYAHYYKLSKDNVILAYGGIQCIFEDAHLMTIATHPQYQKQGLASVLLKQFVRIAKEQGCTKMILEVNTQNHGALHLYHHFGFKQTRIRKNYYGNQDAYEMVLEMEDQ